MPALASTAKSAGLPDLHLQSPRPALLLSTYGQLQAEVAAGILQHFSAPGMGCLDAYSSWDGRQYQLPKDVPPEDVLPERVRAVLILAGCGFPIEQLPADLRQALLTSKHTPSDLHNTLQHAAAAAAAKQLTPGAMSRSSSSASSNGRNSGPSWNCGAWAEGFRQLCIVCAELGLPLVMQPRLPLPHAHGFLDYLAADGCQQLAEMLARQRQYLRQVVQQWPLPGQQGCINAKDYQPKQWAMEAGLSDTALTFEFPVPDHKLMPKAPDVPGTAARMRGAVGAILGARWRELPWLCKDGSAGLVVSGGAVEAYMAKAGAMVPFHDCDLFVIASDADTYQQIVQETCAILDQCLKAVDGGPADEESWDPVHRSWLWEVKVPRHNFPAFFCLNAVQLSRMKMGRKTVTEFTMQTKLVRWQFCSPAALVRCCDIPSVAAWFDGEDVFLDERCAWCHANRLLLADPFFDSISASAVDSARFCTRLLDHSKRLPGYQVYVPGPMAPDHFNHIVSGLVALLKTAKSAGSMGGWDHAHRIIKHETTGIARWALLLACHKVYGKLPAGRQPKPAEEAVPCRAMLSVNSTGLEEYNTAMASLSCARELQCYFAGCFKPPWGNNYVSGTLGDRITWFKGSHLNELPWRLWLALNGSPQAEAG